ncbi:DUF2586 domain-containing protein [Flavobacterium oreochromis]|uniref:DUF2586 family protein n=1 Tax=Flavobacterium columnare TaxID=996 RepID=A0A2D0AHM3_9FLAO|nr:DUF2586 domain-containing protein [Flavobacterium oreochromis]OWP75670.1 hypothetical protein BWK62_11415 [Flavobacterium oreochromis]POR25267.1 hypothetical protein BWK58_07085 [Flavobacterium columnare]QYS85551.1 DUF2586 family protein [Flavobacterium oreochromis]
MSTLNNVEINKLSGGLGRRMPEQDMVSGLLFNGVETDKLKHDTLYRLASVEDAITLGITENYDKDGQSAFYQIDQFFRMNTSGDLFIMVVSNTEIKKTNNVDSSFTRTYADVVKKAKFMQEKTNGAIRQMAIIFNKVSTSFSETELAIDEAQVQANQCFKDFMPLEIILEGKGFNVNTEDLSKLTDLSTKKAENVTLVVAMDLEKGQEYNYSNTAAVGVFLGAVSKAKVSENVAWIEKFNLTGKGFAKAGFVGGKVNRTQGDLNTLNEKRYVFAKTHTGLAGIYFNDSHTCTKSTDDYAYIENNRTINKATRLLRTALLPKLASPVLVDIDGKLPQSVSKSFEGLCRAALEGMLANQEISAFDVYVDPKQNILATSELKVKAEVIPVGTARKIKVDLGFKNPFGIDKA